MQAEQVVYNCFSVCYNQITTEELAVKYWRESYDMKDINIAKNIADLRRKKGVTQEQTAQALSISSQAVSKWETGTSLPDTQTLPLIAEYFGVSIDYLYYGDEYAYGDIYEKVFEKIADHAQMSTVSYEDALHVYASAHHGISRGNLRGKNTEMCDQPAHISNENGLSLLSGKGYAALVTRKFFENVNQETVEFAQTILPELSKKNNLLVCLAIISMSDISFGEMKEQLNFEENTLRQSLDELIAVNVIIEKKSKHKSLGFTYEINEMYHTCLCILIATLEMQRFSLKGISCCMGFGDYPIKL